MNKIRIAIVGVGNCASSLVQGISYHEGLSKNNGQSTPMGLMHPEIGGFWPNDIEPVLAFDIDERKVGRPLHEAIFNPPNCTMRLTQDVKTGPVIVEMGNPWLRAA